MSRVTASGVLGRDGDHRSPSPTLGILRDHTAVAHRELDGALADHGRVTTPADYVRLLTVLGELHARTEAPLLAWAENRAWVREVLGDVRLPSRAGLYAADLDHLGASTLGAHRPSTVTPDGLDDAAGLAALYLLAGSTKGARVLLRGLPTDLAPRARQGLSDAATRESARLWQALVRLTGEPWVRAHPSDHLVLARRAGDEAARTFADLHDLIGRGERRAS